MAVSRATLEILARDRASRSLMRLNRSFGGVTRSMRRFATAALAIGGIGGIGYMVKKQMEAIDVVAKLSDRIGMSTEALVGFQHAAELSGVGTESLHKSLEIFSRRLGEVRMGTGEAQRALDALGLTANQLIARSPAQAIYTIADRMNQLSSAADKAAVANYLFGRSGQQLLNMLAEGSVGLEAMNEEAEKLGLTFSKFDAAQIEAANDALLRMRRVFTGIFRQITIEVAPHIEALATSFVDVATSGRGMGYNVTLAFKYMGLSAISFAEQIDNIIGSIKEAKAGILDFAALTLQTYDKLTWLPAFKLHEKLAGVDFGKLGDELQQQAQALARATVGRAEEYNRARAALERYFDTLEQRSKRIRGQLGWQRWAIEGLEEMGFGQVVRPISPLESIEDRAKKVSQAVDQTVNEIDKRFGFVAARIEYSMTNAFDAMIFEGEKWGDAMKAVFRDIAREFFRQFVAKGLVRAIWGETVGGAFTPGLIPQLFGVKEGHRGGRVAELPVTRIMPAAAFADAQRAHQGLAPDEYPVIARGDEWIVPASKTAGSGPVNVTINNNSGIGLDITSVQMTSLQDIIINVAVHNIVDEGGALRRAVKSVRG